jgi:hypothetical protein
MEDLENESKFKEASKQLKKLTSGAIRLSVIILFSVIAWRIAWSTFSLDLSKFDFSDLLAMILALFAIMMSVAFYFKSTDSSNQFYDNIYNFTQKTSEILGRIEERFGERLKHIDEGYGRIESRFDGITKTPDEIEQKVKETEGKEEKEKEKLKETNRAMREILDQLTKRAQMQQREKEEFYQNMEKLTAEKDSAQERIREIEEDRDRMQQQLHMFERDMMQGLHMPDNPILDELLHHPEIRNLIRKGAPTQIFQRHFQEITSNFPMHYLEQLQDEGVINRNKELTQLGTMMLRNLSRRYR